MTTRAAAGRLIYMRRGQRKKDYFIMARIKCPAECLYRILVIMQGGYLDIDPMALEDPRPLAVHAGLGVDAQGCLGEPAWGKKLRFAQSISQAPNLSPSGGILQSRRLALGWNKYSLVAAANYFAHFRLNAQHIPHQPSIDHSATTHRRVAVLMDTENSPGMLTIPNSFVFLGDRMEPSHPVELQLGKEGGTIDKASPARQHQLVAQLCSCRALSVRDGSPGNHAVICRRILSPAALSKKGEYELTT
ncbi:hypothetical protein B7463_g3864, partial [Scytalidium lignicola]